MIDIEGFETVVSQLILAKELYDIDRFDVVKQNFFDELSWDSYFENILGVISSIFSGFYNDYNDKEDIEIMMFEDDIISDYFIHAWEHGMLYRLPYNQNPYLTLAYEAVGNCLNVSSCSDWKLLGYTKTKRNAQNSKLVVMHYAGCGCNVYEYIAYGLIQLYSWFADRCAEFKALEDVPDEIIADKAKNNTLVICDKPEQEVWAA